jgi:Zn-dependent protease
MTNAPDQPDPQPISGGPLIPEFIEPKSAVVRDPSEQSPARAQLPDIWKRRQRRAWVLFVLTCISTWFVGSQQFPDVRRKNGELLSDAQVVRLGQAAFGEGLQEKELTVSRGYWSGLKYALAVMGILFAHEMGHYLQAKRYKVPATFPFFIPMPISPFGTMGAVILQGSGTADRKSMFDIAISGPLAGLVLAIPILILGIKSSVYQTFKGASISYGDPLLVQYLARWIHGVPGPGEELTLTPLLFAGWVGVFITSLNLIPVGQLDGGHILYCLIGRRAHDFALMIVGFAIAYCWFVDGSYIVIIILLLFMGVKHPPTRNDAVPLNRGRVILGWLTLAFIIIGFTPRPITIPDAETESGEPVKVRADYGDGQAAYNLRCDGEILDLRMSIGNRDNDRAGCSGSAGSGFAVFENHHLTWFHA